MLVGLRHVFKIFDLSQIQQNGKFTLQREGKNGSWELSSDN
jgi:hypothetical protein